MPVDVTKLSFYNNEKQLRAFLQKRNPKRCQCKGRNCVYNLLWERLDSLEKGTNGLR